MPMNEHIFNCVGKAVREVRKNPETDYYEQLDILYTTLTKELIKEGVGAVAQYLTNEQFDSVEQKLFEHFGIK